MTKQLSVEKGRAKGVFVRYVTLLITFVIVLSVIVACGGGGNGDTLPADQAGATPPAGGAALTCSQECSDRGQCGESTDRGTVVLLNMEEPSVSAADHDLAIPAATAVTVTEERTVNVVENATGSEFPVIFYRVFVPERNVEAWVAGWCVLNPQS